MLVGVLVPLLLAMAAVVVLLVIEIRGPTNTPPAARRKRDQYAYRRTLALNRFRRETHATAARLRRELAAEFDRIDRREFDRGRRW